MASDNPADGRAADIGQHDAADHHGGSLSAVAVIGGIKDIGLTGDKGGGVTDPRQCAPQDKIPDANGKGGTNQTKCRQKRTTQIHAQ